MLSKLAIWYLRKRKKSVLIGYRVVGGKMNAIYNKSYTYDNQLINVDYWYGNGKKLVIPEGEFTIKIKE